METMSILNYFIEANAGLILILACYFAFLRRETNFKFVRIFLLAGIFASLIFPLIHVETGQDSSPLSIGQVIPSYWLPEVVIGADATDVSEPSFQFWKYTTVIYTVLLVTFSLVVIFQLLHLFRLIRRAQTYRLEKLYIAESAEDKPTFSFFNFIFIGKANALTDEEKQQIIRHESVHAKQWHSFDILLVNVLKIFFWFNPFISTYKKIFIQLHEFEADARAVENADVNKYCSLLAKVALQSADFTLANHFNNSLTVKRIEMMRTLKSNIKRWKLVALALMLPLVFFFVACQDQVGADIMEITKNSTHALMIPKPVQARFDYLKAEHPEKNYVVLELNETASQKIQDLESQYGLPKTIEVFGAEGTAHLPSIKGESTGLVVFEHNEDSKSKKRNQPAFAIVEFNDQASKLADQAAGQEKIYTVVEQQPEFPGGYTAMMDFIRENMRYPADARQQGIEGTVYVSFIVQSDGTVTDEKIIRGIGASADAEAKRVLEISPNWIPGKQSGEPVSVRFVLPIKFNLNKTEPAKE